MVIFKENKKKTLSETIVQVNLQNFYKLVGKKRTCRASWTAKSGYPTVNADPPAFCGFNNGYFYITTSDGYLSVNFKRELIAFIWMDEEDYNNGAPDYVVAIKDGSKIYLSLL